MYKVHMLIILFVIALVMSCHADDQFTCCMKGVKAVRNVVICPAPCCYGYQQKVVYATILARIIYCEKTLEEDSGHIEDFTHKLFVAPNAYQHQ